MSNAFNETDWRKVVQRLIKAEMSKRGMKYQTLSIELAKLGTQQSADNLRNKINRGILGADLLLQLMVVMNIRKVGVDEIQEICDSL